MCDYCAPPPDERDDYHEPDAYEDPRIARAEWMRDHGGNDSDWKAEQDSYERWLDRIGGSL